MVARLTCSKVERGVACVISVVHSNASLHQCLQDMGLPKGSSVMEWRAPILCQPCFCKRSQHAKMSLIAVAKPHYVVARAINSVSWLTCCFLFCCDQRQLSGKAGNGLLWPKTFGSASNTTPKACWSTCTMHQVPNADHKSQCKTGVLSGRCSHDPGLALYSCMCRV